MPRDLLAGLEQPQQQEQRQPRDLLAGKGFKPVPEQDEAPAEEGWLDKAKNFGKGAYLGFLESAGGLLEMVTDPAAKIQKRAAAEMGYDYKTPLDKVVGDAREWNKDTGAWGTAGQVVGGLAGLAPLGPVLGGIGKLGSATTRLGKAGLAAARGAAQGAVAGGVMYNEDGGFNAGSAAAGALMGGAIGPAANAIGAFAKGKFGNDELIGKAYNKIIKSLSGKVAAADSKAKAESIARRSVQALAKKVKGDEQKAWDSLLGGIKDKPVDAVASANLRNKAKIMLMDTKDEMPAPVQKWVQNHLLSGKELSFGKLKELRTLYRDHVTNVWKKQGTGDVTHSAAVKARGLYDEITEALKSTAKANDKLPDFISANEISKQANQLAGEVGLKMTDIATSKAVAANFISKLVPNSASGAAQNMQSLSKLSPKTANTVRAKELQDLAVKSLGPDGSFNLTSFFNGIKKNAKIEGVLDGTPQLRALQGLEKALTDASQRGIIKEAFGSSANFSPVLKLGTNMLDKLTGGSRNLRRDLIRYNLLDKNETARQFYNNKLSDYFTRAGVTLIPQGEGEIKVDIKGDDK